MDVIPGRISEDDVIRLGEVLFSKIAACCTKVVLIDIKLYLKKKNSNAECREIVAKAFEGPLFIADVVKDKEMMDAIRIVETLQYDSVDAAEQLDTLKNYQHCLKLVKECAYAQPYRSAVSSAYIKDVITQFKEAGYDDIARKLDRGKSVFYEPTNARAVGTPFKNVNYAEERLAVIRPGINFLIRMKEKGITPVAWRHL